MGQKKMPDDMQEKSAVPTGTQPEGREANTVVEMSAAMEASAAKGAEMAKEENMTGEMYTAGDANMNEEAPEEDVTDAADVRKGKPRRRFPYRPLLAGIMGAVVLVFALLFFILPKETFSEVRQKALTRLHSVSIEDLWNSRYADNLKEHVVEQFPFHDKFQKIYNMAQKLSGVMEKNGIYLFGNNGYAEDIVVPEEKDEADLITQLTAFAAARKDANIQFLLAPNAASICRAKLAVDAPIADQNALMDDFFQKVQEAGIATIDVRQELRAHADEYLYYRTDPRWTSDAAVLAFDTAAVSLGFKTGKNDFTKKTVEGTFVGRLAALCGLREPEPDVLTLYRAKKQPKAVVYDRSDGRGAGRRLAKLYDSTCLGTVDAYKYFLGGDYPLLRLTSGKAKTDRRLLIIKDSYANCILPLFSKYYAQVDVVDVHRYTGNLDALMEKDQISEVLFLCNANTLFSDTSLAGLLGGGKA